MRTKLSLILVLISTLSFAQETKNFIDKPYMEVTGKGELEVTPDEIYLSIKLKEADNKGKESVEALEKKMVLKLKALGIDVEEALSIMDFSSNFRSYWLRKTNILTSKEYQLLVKDGTTAGQVFMELEKLGISNISIVKVDHSKIDQLRNDVKVKAIQAAKDKASMLAKGIGQSAGKAIYIQELNTGYYPRNTMATNIRVKAFAELEEQDFMPEIEFEKIKLEYSILVRFELN
ncbi:MAG: SIMPL domain-containing protein [Bacteroidetes bacterium]|jgi:uncharacterized protein|nr:SIMPL domain-containing protein [Bacteroidota bacterium]MBT3751604.1 SIMPL domain-containing protein [Bacteroidota bacterium]MBT4399963.1 SIMPL domain-containing protein [Bacteroidota bacterium]MBT4409069.1 SIMPL domain-containing protein [Bacteroidota bacterium]MBT5426903.1 SIMPL domain-containing protein [Bacteroidota bacterium]